MTKQLTTQAQNQSPIVKAHFDKKIRDYTKEEKAKLTPLTINYLLTLLGVSETDETSLKHGYLLLNYLIDDIFRGYSYQDIKIAFNMAIKGDLGVKMFQRLDAVIFGRVMQAYSAHKTLKLKIYMQDQQKAKQLATQKAQEPTPAEIVKIMTKAVKRIKKDFADNGIITENCGHVYDYLAENGKLNTDLAYKNKMFALAKIHAKHEAIRDTTLTKKTLETALNKIKAGQSNRTVKIAKRLVLEDYFKSL